MTILTLVRHGETDWNRGGRIQGSTDIPLNDTGRAQAREAGRLLAAQGWDAPVVVSSDLSRAAETADLIAGELGVGVHGRYRGLRERGYGVAEGMDAAQFRDRFGDWHDADVPDAEPWPRVRARALASLHEIVQDVAPSHGDVEIVAVAHGALIRQVIRHATAEELPLDGERLPNGSAHRFAIEPDGLRLLSYAGAAV